MAKKIKQKLSLPKGALKSYNEHYGRIKAELDLLESKQAGYGSIRTQDRYNTTTRLPSSQGYTTLNRRDIYGRAAGSPLTANL